MKTSTPTTIIHNACIINASGRMQGYVCVDARGMISDVQPGTPSDSLLATASRVIDANGDWLLPGVIDEHVHFRDPGLTHKADVATESRAAAAGGITSVMDMPNTAPTTTSLEAWQAKMERYAEASVVNYACWIGASAHNIDQLLEADYSRVPGVKIFAGTSTGNMAVGGDDLFRRIFREVPALKAVHAEDDAIIADECARITAHYGAADAVPVNQHPNIRSRRACAECTDHLVKLRDATDARLQVMHISTADELQYFSPAADKPLADKRLTAETCVQYLWWSDSDYERLGAGIKCNPAIKADSDRRALLKAVRDGLIDVIATDHAPHLPADKQGGALKAASGIPLIQFSLPMMLELAHQGHFTAETVVEKMCHAPAIIFGIDRRGFIAPGYHADMVLVSAGHTPYTVKRDMIQSKCGWSPLEGTSLHHRVLATWVNGRMVWNGTECTDTGAAQPLRFTPRQ